MPGKNFYLRILLILTTAFYCGKIVAQPPCSSIPATPSIGSLYQSTCANVAFNVVRQNYSSATAPGMRYAYQVSVDSMNWTNISNTSAPVPYVTVTQTVTSYYRLVDTCLNSGMSVISNVIKITMGFQNCYYCLPNYTYGCAGNTHYINRVNMGWYNSVATGCASGGFDNSRSLYIGDFVRGNTNYMSVTTGSPGAPGTSGDNMKIWIDYNDNAAFDTNEEVTTLTGVTSTTFGFSFLIPANANIGRHIMRIRLAAGVAASSIDPCATYAYGEAHDYEIGIIGCSGTPSSGTITTSTNANQLFCTPTGTNFTLVQQTGSVANPDTRYSWQSSTDSINWTNLTNSSGPVSPLSILVSSPTWFRRVDTCLLSGASAITNAIKLQPLTNCPANNFCSTAVDLPVGSGFCASPLLGNLYLADSTTGLPLPTCAFVYKKDLWYKVTVPASGNVTVQTSAVNITVSDLALQAYAGNCGVLTLLGCDNDGNPDNTPSANHARLAITGRTPGEIIYFRVLANSINNVNPEMNGPFAICAFDSTPGQMPSISPGSPGSCSGPIPINIDSVYKYTWVSFTDASGNIVAQLYPNGSNLGLTNTSIYMNNGPVRSANNGTMYFLDRNFTITPTTQPTSVVTARFYFTNQELNALSAVSGGVTRSQLNGSKTTQPCSSSANPIGGIFFAQTGNSAYGSGHYINTNLSSFSTFYLHSGNTPIPVKIEFFKGTGNGLVHQLRWKVSTINTQYAILTLETSRNGRDYSTLVSLKEVALRCEQPFEYTNSNPFAGINYYRLKMADDKGIINYSAVVTIKSSDHKPAITDINPNPVSGSSVLLSLVSGKTAKAEIVVTDIAGRIAIRQPNQLAAGMNTINMNVASLAKGTYQVYIVTADGNTKAQRFVKE